MSTFIMIQNCLFNVSHIISIQLDEQNILVYHTGPVRKNELGNLESCSTVFTFASKEEACYAFFTLL